MLLVSAFVSWHLSVRAEEERFLELRSVSDLRDEVCRNFSPGSQDSLPDKTFAFEMRSPPSFHLLGFSLSPPSSHWYWARYSSFPADFRGSATLHKTKSHFSLPLKAVNIKSKTFQSQTNKQKPPDYRNTLKDMPVRNLSGD